MNFQSRTYGSVDIREIAHIIRKTVSENPDRKYVLAVGSDSQNTYDTKIVQVLVLHTVGTGGIFFYHTERVRRIQSLREKLITETEKSLRVADEMLKELENLFDEDEFDYTTKNIALQFHCDVGNTGKSSTMIKEVIGYVKGVLQENYDVLIKPEAFAASSIADKISKPSFCA